MYRKPYQQPTVNTLLDAAKTGNISLIEDALRWHIDINAQDMQGNTALILAISSLEKYKYPLYKNTVEFLLDSGANPSIKNNLGESAFIIALRDKNEK